MSKGKAIALGVVVAILAVLVLAYSSLNGLRNSGVQYETQLSAQYLDNQNYLSAYISGFYEQVGVAKVKADKLNAILLDAVKGRYDGKMAPGTGGAFFSAIAEAYPDLSGLNIYDKIVDYVASGREGYRNVQSKLLDMLRTYDTWRNSGIVQSVMIKSVLGFPSENLAARVGASKLTGQAALDKMYQLVLTKDAQNAYENGTLDPLTIPNN